MAGGKDGGCFVPRMLYGADMNKSIKKMSGKEITEMLDLANKELKEWSKLQFDLMVERGRRLKKGT